MKKAFRNSKGAATTDLPDMFSKATFRRKNKKRLLPEVFYLQWEFAIFLNDSISDKMRNLTRRNL